MNENQIMISAAMLETMWRYRHKDLIDLVTPFVMCAIAHNTSVDEEIDVVKVQRYVQENYAYVDFPEVIVRRILNRNPSVFEKKYKRYFLKVSLDSQATSMEGREKECLEHLNFLGQKIADYLNNHCQKVKKTITPEYAIKYLSIFFERYGLQIGINDLESTAISPKDYEIDYYIAQFVFEQKDVDSLEYKYINDLVKGYFLRLAIYSQPENGNIASENYSEVIFFYDTPILLDILGYQGEERANNARILNDMLRKQKAKLRYFPHTEKEIIDILSAYRHSLIPNDRSTGTRTLTGLNQQRFDPNDVRVEIATLESKLSTYFIEKEDVPPYAQKENGVVDDRDVLDEVGIREYIRHNTPHYKENSLNNDISSVLAIHRFRQNTINTQIEKCKYLFVTNNIDFIKAFNSYYRNHVNQNTFPLVISDNNLSALTWIKCGEVANLPEMELLKNAYSAMQPAPEIMTKLEQVLEKMNFSGKITQAEISALKISPTFLNEIWINSFGDFDAVTEDTVANAEQVYREKILRDNNAKHEEIIKKLTDASNETIKELQYALNEKDIETRKFEKERRENAHRQANLYAKKEKEQWLNSRIKFVKILFAVLVVVGVLGAILSYIYGNIKISVFGIFLAIIGALSNKDTIFQRKNRIISYLERKSNEIETHARERKLSEYLSLNNFEKQK